MALIKCKECGKDYSNLAQKCPNCGLATELNEEQSKLIKCIECNNVYSRNDEACPQCGCPTYYNLPSINHNQNSNLIRKIKARSILRGYFQTLYELYTTYIVKNSILILSVFTLILLIVWGIQTFSTQEQQDLTNEVDVQSAEITTSVPIDLSSTSFPVAIKPEQRIGILNTEMSSSQKFGYKQATTDSSSIRVTSLTTNSISIKLNQPSTVVLLDHQGKLIKENTSQSTGVSFDGLKENTDYVLMSLNNKNEYQDYIVFETMNPTEDIDLQYIINLDDSNSEELTIDIFGYYNGVTNYLLNNEHYHTRIDELNILHDSMIVKTSGTFDVKWSPETKVALSFTDKKGYFQVTYTSKKTATQSTSGSGRIEGRKTNSYLIATGEQVLILPVRSNSSITEDISLSINAPQNWGYNIGFTEPIDGFYKVEGDKEWMPLVPIQAYNLDNYIETSLKYPDMTFEFVYPKIADETEVNQLYDAWDMLYQIWGRSPEKGLRYTLFVADDNVSIYGGEYSTGQSYSTAYGLLNEMGVHQFYHVWQGWKYYIETNETYEKWWGEGFNRYFSHKVLEAVGDTNEGFQQLGNYYSVYKSSLDQGYKTSLLSTEYPYSGYEYNVGALFTYAMDKMLQSETNGSYSMDMVLKHVLDDWIDKGTHFTYSGMIDYINETSGVDFTQFFKDYLEDAKTPLILDEFESIAATNTGQSSDLFDGGIYGMQGPVELFGSKFNNIFSGNIEWAANNAISDVKLNNFKYTAILHSLDMGEFPTIVNQVLGIESNPELNKLNIYHNSKGGVIYVILTKTEDELMTFINNLSDLE